MIDKKKENYISNADLTDAVIEYNLKNNPIKIFNNCFDYYVETYNEVPVRCANWDNVIEVHQDFEFRKIEKSTNRRAKNKKSAMKVDLEEISEARKDEVRYFISEVRKKDPEKGKYREIDYPEVIWRGIEQIANRYSTNYKFFQYTYREDMVMTAIEKCLRYLGNFSGVSSKNVFSFFTSIIHFSFLDSINREYAYNNFKQRINDRFYEGTEEDRVEHLTTHGYDLI